MKFYFPHSISLRIRYSETDKMGFCYYGNYPAFLELARVEALRSLGVIYAELEEQGMLLPVKSLSIDYKKPLRYDELIRVESILTQVTSCTLQFEYTITGEDNQLRTRASTTLVFTDSISLRPLKVPDQIMQLILPYEVR